MPHRRRFTAIAWAAATVGSFSVAGWIATDTIRTVVSLHSALPWFDDWNTVNLFRDWRLGTSSAFTALFSQFGEHRLLVPRLVVFADDLFFRGQGWLTLGVILMVQAIHTALFASVLAGAKSRGAGRWGAAGLVATLMFSLRQAPNFTSSFQLQFVGVFAAATLAVVLVEAQAAARPALYQQKFVEDDAADLLLLGLDNPAVILRTAWDDATVRRDRSSLREARISVFGGPEADLIGRPLAEAGRIAAPETCSGSIAAAHADPSLGPEGVRVDGRGRDEAHHRRLRRVLLVDRTGSIVGLAVSGIPGRDFSDWSGFSRAPAGSILTAYGEAEAGVVCRLDAATVSADSSRPGESLSVPGAADARDPE